MRCIGLLQQLFKNLINGLTTAVFCLLLVFIHNNLTWILASRFLVSNTILHPKE